MSSKKPPPAPPAPRLYLATPPVTDASSLAPCSPSCSASADVAAVLVRLAQADDRSKINRVKALAATVQDAARRCCSTAMSSWSRARARTARM